MKNLFAVLLISIIIPGCQKELYENNDQPLSFPTVTTNIVTSITSSTATSGGSISFDGGAAVTQRGVCWGISHDPSLTGNHTMDGTGMDTFVSNITGLTASTTYYLRAYAMNAVDTAYGNEETFITTTIATALPTVTTTVISSLAQTSAQSGGTIVSDGGASITARGVCWSTAVDPVVTGSHTNDGTGPGIFSNSITGLTANTTYHVRAYASNSAGTAYGNDISFNTPAGQTAAGTLFIGGISDGKLYAMDNATGDVKWSFQTGGGIINSPTVLGNTVFIGSNDYHLYAINATTGDQQWNYYTGTANALETTVTADQSYIYLSSTNGKLYKIDTALHYESWSTINGGGGRGTSPVVSNGLVFSGAANTISAYNKTTGTRVWQYTLGDWSNLSNATVVNNVVYVFAQNSTVYALNALNGNLIWKKATDPGNGGSQYSSPTIYNGKLYVGSSFSNGGATNQVCAMDISTGNINWFSEAPGEAGNIAMGPLVYNNTLYGVSDHGYLYAWDATTGALKWKYNTGYNNNYSFTGPTIADGTVFFTTENGTVYAVNASNGILKWQKKITTGTNRIVYSNPCVVDANGVVHHPGDSGEQQ